MKTLILPMIFLLSLTACTTVKWEYPRDNFLEEAVESYIEKQTGTQIDFSPEEPLVKENKDNIE